MEYFPLVDKNDNVIGKIGSDEPISDYKQIRFANAILFRGNKIIVPKRTMTKKLYPGRYDYSAGGHVNYGESYLETITREAKEELGIDIYDVQEVAYLNPYIDDVGCFSCFFIAKYNENQEINYSPEEVASIHFFTVDEILSMIDENPTMFKPDYIVAFKKYFRQISNDTNLNMN